MIEEILPGNTTRLRILQILYENPGIHLTALIRKVNASPNLVLAYVNQLSSLHLIIEEKKSGKKKVHLRKLYACFDNELSRLVYSCIEINKQLLFFKKYQTIKGIFEQLTYLLKEKDISVLVFGSYARFSAMKDSDLDILVIGNVNKVQIQRIKELFITLDTVLSLKVETQSDFLKNIHKPLYQNILREHIIVHGAVFFMNIMARI